MENTSDVENWDFDKLNNGARVIRSAGARSAMSATAQALDSGELSLNSSASDFEQVDRAGFIDGAMSQVAGEMVKIVPINPETPPSKN
ncbi:MAG TPA: hypothetical protein VF401_02955 [Candidatus Saccharimonadales bacterium]